MTLIILSTILAIVSIAFFIARKEFIYAVVLVIMFLVALPLVVNFDTLVDRYPNAVLMLDYSDSSRSIVGNVERSLEGMGFDFIRRFGEPYNKPDDFININDSDVFFVVSDFLFQVPKELENKTNIIFVSLGNRVFTNHLVSNVSIINIGQVDYLNIGMIAKSEIKVIDYRSREVLYKGSASENHIIPVDKLKEEILISSLNTNIYYKVQKTPNLLILWFEFNRDLRSFVNAVKGVGYRYDLLLDFEKDKSVKVNEVFDSLVVGYPRGSVFRFRDILGITREGSKVVVVGADDEFVREVFSFSKVRNVKLTESDFTFVEGARVFDISFSYPVVIDEVARYSFPKVSGEVASLDKVGISVYLKYEGREFIFVLAKDITKVDVDNLKVGVYSSFASDFFGSLLRFFVKDSGFEGSKVLFETAFSGARNLGGNSIVYEKLSRDLVESVKKRYSSKVVDTVRIDISSWWVLMVFVILSLAVRWFLKS
ncbi:MAG: hypothetical protein N3D81_03420 [Spirochaetes bacterium]|nr:hypothetical protein [Spirochaetota bacterium]